MEPLPAFGERTRSGPEEFEIGKLLTDLRHQPRQFRDLLGLEAAPAGANRIGPEPLGHGCIRHLPLSGVAPAAYGRMSLVHAGLI
jgi:hypothetical protein